MNKIKKKLYLRNCKRCGNIYRSEFKHSHICIECRPSKSINSKHHYKYIIAKEKEKLFLATNDFKKYLEVLYKK